MVYSVRGVMSALKARLRRLRKASGGKSSLFKPKKYGHTPFLETLHVTAAEGVLGPGSGGSKTRLTTRIKLIPEVCCNIY